MVRLPDFKETPLSGNRWKTCSPLLRSWMSGLPSRRVRNSSSSPCCATRHSHQTATSPNYNLANTFSTLRFGGRTTSTVTTGVACKNARNIKCPVAHEKRPLLWSAEINAPGCHCRKQDRSPPNENTCGSNRRETLGHVTHKRDPDSIHNGKKLGAPEVNLSDQRKSRVSRERQHAPALGAPHTLKTPRMETDGGHGLTG